MWQTLSLFLCVSSAIVCYVLAVRTFRAARAAVETSESLRSSKCSCASRVESLAACQAEMEETLKVLANRVKMQRVRTAALHVGDPPTIGNDPASVKAELRRRAGLVAGQPAPHQ